MIWCPARLQSTKLVTLPTSQHCFFRTSSHPCRKARVAVERDSRPSPVGAGWTWNTLGSNHPISNWDRHLAYFVSHCCKTLQLSLDRDCPTLESVSIQLSTHCLELLQRSGFALWLVNRNGYKWRCSGSRRLFCLLPTFVCRIFKFSGTKFLWEV